MGFFSDLFNTLFGKKSQKTEVEKTILPGKITGQPQDTRTVLVNQRGRVPVTSRTRTVQSTTNSSGPDLLSDIVEAVIINDILDDQVQPQDDQVPVEEQDGFKGFGGGDTGAPPPGGSWTEDEKQPDEKQDQPEEREQDSDTSDNDSGSDSGSDD